MSVPGFGFGVTPGPPDGVAAEIRDAEALGFDRMGVWDSPALFRDPWMTLGAVARETSTIRLGTWVSNPVSRHPVVTASAIATLEDLAPGRTYLGIGSGGTGVWHLGHPAARLADLKEYVSAVRALLADGTTTYQGSECRLEWGRGVSVPIIMSAHGPRALRLAGEIADGVICGLGILPKVVSGCLDLISEGAESAGRTLADLEVWFTASGSWIPSRERRWPRAPGRPRRSPCTSPRVESRASSCPSSTGPASPALASSTTW